jgi:hypothetical protein
MDHAACKGLTKEMFPKKHKDISYINSARAICDVCPVIRECKAYALQFPATDMHGVWAKMTPRQLAREQKRLGITPSKPTLAQTWGQ